YVLDRISVLAFDEGLARSFMEAITTESHRLFGVEGGGGGESDDDYRDSEGGELNLPTDEDLDERLRRAKERFEEIVEVEKREGTTQGGEGMV
ncbi:hypothetical protein TrRE_jg2100, partial [Triparma retinervis]